VIEGLVSTIIPVHNRASLLREAVQSVLSQDWEHIEVVIVDDGSTDETPDAAQAMAREHPSQVRHVRQDNRGPGAARECGRLLAAGEFIQYLDSDDLLLPAKFELQVAGLRGDAQAGVAYGIAQMRNAAGVLEPSPHKRTGERIDTMFPSFLTERWWETATPLYRRSVTDRAGPWTNLSLEEDWEYDCRIASQGTRLAWVGQPVSESRDHAGHRLSRGPAIDARRLRHRAAAQELIFGHAMRAGIPSTAPELQHFARALFLLARQCGAANLDAESQLLFELAQRAAGRDFNALQFNIYRHAAQVFGWSAAGSASCWLDRLRAGLKGEHG
jgi:hypothetical protein